MQFLVGVDVALHRVYIKPHIALPLLCRYLYKRSFRLVLAVVLGVFRIPRQSDLLSCLSSR